MFQLFVPFLAVIVISLVLVELSYPLYRHIYKLLGHKVTASLISTLATLLFVIIPLIILFLLAFSEISTLLTSLPAVDTNNMVLGESIDTNNNLVLVEKILEPYIDSVNATLSDLNLLDAQGNLVQHIEVIFLPLLYRRTFRIWNRSLGHWLAVISVLAVCSGGVGSEAEGGSLHAAACYVIITARDILNSRIRLTEDDITGIGTLEN
jgi:predicted PurR-regulated permease PerM